MASGDITLLSQKNNGQGGRVYAVASGTAIYAGEPVQVLLGSSGTVVFPALTSTPTVGTHYFVGVAQTNSTNTTSAAGTVTVDPISAGDIWLIAPATAASWDTQSEYDALVGSRVLLQNSVTVTSTPTSGTYTILASDSANNGCVVQPLNIFKYPGKVAFSFRNGANYLA